MELKDLVKYYVPMRMEGSSPPNWEVVFGYDISKFKGYNVDEVRVALNLTQLWLSQGPRALSIVVSTKCNYCRKAVNFYLRDSKQENRGERHAKPLTFIPNCL